MQQSSLYQPSQPLSLSASTESATYALFGLALALTVLGVIAGFTVASTLLATGMYLVLLFVEMGIVFTSSWWMHKPVIRMVLFPAFPLLSGITLAPYLLLILSSYTNGFSIVLNALGAAACMGVAAGIFARVTRVDLSLWARGLVFALIGLVVLGLLQVFVPALRTTTVELFISGAGVAVFAVFTAYDIQRISQMGRVGANPFVLALSLYLDIFNLFLYILRFMTALSGNRR